MSDPQLSSNSSLPFQMSQSNPSLMNKEAPELAPSSATPHVVTVTTPGKMVAVGSLSPHTPVNTATIPASPIFLPNSAVISQTPMTKPAEGVAPNIVVQPTPAQQFQQSMAETTQTLINALTSLAPQDKFKAKEYLQKHPDYLPRIINTLKHQQREQEAFQIQQEFMGAPHAPIYQNPMPPRPMSRTNMTQGVMPPSSMPSIPGVVGMDYSNRPMYQQHPMMGGSGVPLRQPQPYPTPPPSQMYPFGTAGLSIEQTSQQQQVS